MRFNIRNEMRESNYRRLVEFLRDNPDESIKLFPGFVDFPFLSVEPLTVSQTEHGYVLAAEIFLEEPIGRDALKEIASDPKTGKCLDIGHADVRLENIVSESRDLESGLNLSLRALEHAVNRICLWYNRLVDFTFLLDSTWLDKQFDLKVEEEIKKRAEIAKPYAVIHANGTKDAEKLAGDLVPVYVGRDKTYLYEAKKLFRLLPRDFVRRLFALTESWWVPEKEFKGEEREILNEFARWGYVKKRLVMKAVHFSDLDSRTRRHLLASLHRTKPT